ncbi:MAG: 30S ribosomal protein S8e [Candidatus Aenigmarchaeota archaeon]|nr:30S ribosomal protein S8e [Candidatus Aenigmarchaeota archaeon]
MITQNRSRRKPTGGIIVANRKKKKYEMGREKLYVTLGDERKKIIKTRGNGKKIRMLSYNFVNLTDKKTKKTMKVKIKTVSENSANINYVRRNIITKGSIIETEKGKAKVTSRPSQTGIINAILIE